MRVPITSSWLSTTPHGSTSPSMALHHFLRLFITTRGSSSLPLALHHVPWLSVTPPCLSSLYFSRPAPLLLYHSPPTSRSCPPAHAPAAAARSQQGSWGSLAASSCFAHGPILGDGFSHPGLQPPQGATSCPNPPSCGASTLWRCPTALCPSPPHFGALWISLILAHGEPRPNCGALEGPWRVAVETCRNRVGSARAWLGRSGAGSYREAVGERWGLAPFYQDLTCTSQAPQELPPPVPRSCRSRRRDRALV